MEDNQLHNQFLKQLDGSDESIDKRGINPD